MNPDPLNWAEIEKEFPVRGGQEKQLNFLHSKLLEAEKAGADREYGLWGLAIVHLNSKERESTLATRAGLIQMQAARESKGAESV